MIYAQKQGWKTVASICLLMGLWTFIAIGAELSPSWIWAGLALIHYIVVCGVTFRLYPIATILFLWFIFLRFTAMISGVAIESGSYMPEVNLTGVVTGGTVRHGLLLSATIIFAVMVINKILEYLPAVPENPEAIVSKWAYPVFAITILVCLGILKIGFENGFPLIEHIDRMVYWETVKSRFLDFFISNRVIFVVLLGAIFSSCSGLKKHIALGIFLSLMLTSILFSEKFTSLCLMLIYFITPSFLLNPTQFDVFNKRIIFLGIAIPVLTFPFIMLAYGFHENPTKALERFKNRASSQAQLWYVEDIKTKEMFKFDEERVSFNIQSMKMLSVHEDFRYQKPYIGAVDYMAEYMPKVKYKSYKRIGVKFTMAMEAYMLKLFGYIGMIPIYWLFVAVFCAQLSYIAYGIVTLNPLRVIFGAKLWVWTDHALSEGLMYFALGLKPVLFMVCVLGFEIFIRLVFKKKKSINPQKPVTADV